MIEEQALVVGIEHDQALLEIVRSQPCGICGQTRGCGVSLWGRLLGHRNTAFRADNTIDASPGDCVVVGIDEQALLTGSLLVYGVPLLAVLAGAGLAVHFAGYSSPRDGYAVLGAVLGLALGLFWLRGHAAGGRFSVRCRPVILRSASRPDFRSSCQKG